MADDTGCSCRRQAIQRVYDNLVPEDKADIPPDTKVLPLPSHLAPHCTQDASPEWGRTVQSLQEDQNVFDTEQFPDY
eukprot:750306-Hanusia_phi.AAC.1